MAELFSDEWMKGFMNQWNAESELSGALAQIGFNSVIGYGFEGEPGPRGVINVQGGQAVAAGAYQGGSLNWDIRASKEQWEKWLGKPPGMMGLGTAYMSGKLKFPIGDYASMIKDPRMAGPFVKTFAVMARV